MRIRAAGFALICLGCGALGTSAQHDTRPANETAQAHLLLFPSAVPEELLGRAVRITNDGAWTIASARSPGCDVRVKREASAFHTKRRVDIRSATSVSTGYARLIGLEAKFGRATQADIDIQNSEVLRADTRGDCGDVIVDAVFVGRGRRALLSASSVALGANASAGLVSGSLGEDASTTVLDDLSWSDEQGYGFTYAQVSAASQLSLDLSVPSELHEGDEVVVQLNTNRPAFLVVYFLGADGQGAVLWPSKEEPAPHTEAGVSVSLPSPREVKQGIRLRARLLHPDKAARETLIAYAFADQSDFERLKPAVGGAEVNGAEYAAQLTQQLESIPLNRWTRTAVSYVIAPPTQVGD